ncbi:MAG: hypothetical protein ACYSWU_04705, partial [Planctomycetota bacterium]
PDYGFLFQHDQSLLLCLTEASSGEESPRHIGQKLQRYAQWAQSPEGRQFMTGLYGDHGAKAPRPQFRLVFVVQNRRTANDFTRLKQIFSEALRLPKTLRHRIWATTVAALAGAANVDARVWIRGTDLEPPVLQWQTLPQTKRDRFLSSLLRRLPNHRFSPLPEDPCDVPSR